MDYFNAKRTCYNINNNTICDNLIEYYTKLIKNGNTKLEDILEFFQEKILKELEKYGNTT